MAVMGSYGTMMGLQKDGRKDSHLVSKIAVCCLVLLLVMKHSSLTPRIYCKDY